MTDADRASRDDYEKNWSGVLARVDRTTPSEDADATSPITLESISSADVGHERPVAGTEQKRENRRAIWHRRSVRSWISATNLMRRILRS